tara:strand:+ start:220 stop:621 length:402 start_codon:yes stop_codon:yes gene_type:complete
MSIFRELNQDMLFVPRFQFSDHQVPIGPFQTNQGYGRNETTALNFVPTQNPITNQTMATTIETYNAANLNPRTYRGAGNVAGTIPDGYARGMVTQNTDLINHAPGKPLIMTNAQMFENVAQQERPVNIRPSYL